MTGCYILMNNNANFEEQKEVDCMALAQKRNPGCIITCGKEKTFFKKVNENCEKLRERATNWHAFCFSEVRNRIPEKQKE